MVQVEEQSRIDELKTKIKRLNSKGGQLKMDLHDLAEGLPTDFEKIMEVASKTYEVFHQLSELRQELKTLEQTK
ncbi:CCE_0567 family metalloprotein [Lyngbya aestuarii]|uniref:CCE_0567 family metalloprotein n=1 Tax=Lyngbya aestuarii TaxID=118322 RepID=UPI00403DBCB0